MQPELIARLVNLVKKQGDRVVLADQETGEAVVVMGLDQYEQMLVGGNVVPARPQAMRQPGTRQTLTEEEMFSKVGEPQKVVPQAVPRKAAVQPVERPADVLVSSLTKDEFIDKLTRDIGNWKNAQDKTRADELKAKLVQPKLVPESALEDEERFYLEPIE